MNESAPVANLCSFSLIQGDMISCHLAGTGNHVPAADAMGTREFDYDALVRPLEPRMMRLIWRIVRHREAADDALQDALAVIWRKREAVAGHPNPQALIFRIAAGAALDAIRKNRRRFKFEASGAVEGRADPDAATVEKDMEDRSLRAAVLDAIGRLPGRQAEAALLHIVEEKPFAEIAQAMGCAEITARVHVSRARKTLARRLAAYVGKEKRDEG